MQPLADYFTYDGDIQIHVDYLVDWELNPDLYNNIRFGLRNDINEEMPVMLAETLMDEFELM